VKHEIDLHEAVKLGAVDSSLFNRIFFPKTAKQITPPMHREVDSILDSDSRLINILMARGWAKTSKLRMYTGKRISYGLSRTIMYIGASQAHSRRSLYWLRMQIEKNTLWAQTFQLKKGMRWTDEEMHILQGPEQEGIWIMGAGITSNSLRGVNFDDYRPDLIVLDDVMNDENNRTKEGIEKISDILFGAIIKSLAPRSENPHAKLVMLNTPQAFGDISQQAAKDSAFTTYVAGCWSKETAGLPLEHRKSAWPERVSTADLHKEYAQYAARNRLSIFIREMECNLTTPETSAFKQEWLQFYKDEDLPPLHEMWIIMILDPVPPPTEQQLMKGVVEGDYEAISILGRHKGKIYLLESVTSRGHNPNWTKAEFFRLARKWNIKKALIEVVAYQSAVSWMLREEMKKLGVFYMIEEFGRGDKRPKSQKITDGLTGPASNLQLYVKETHTAFIDQFINYSLIKKTGHDDVLETVALGCIELQNKGFNLPGNGDVIDLDSDDYAEIDDFRGAP
jgi:hypothetical protein